MVRLKATIVLSLLALCLPSVGLAKKCKKKGKKTQVFIKPNTPLRRGPGLNYQVATFLERGRCAPFSEVSMDRSWVLVDTGEKLGWVERGQLSAKSQELIAKAGNTDGPIGSGQKRSYVEATEQITLMELPNTKAAPKSILPAGSQLLPFARTENGAWIQVRDERSDLGWVLASKVKGKGIADLPITKQSLVDDGTTDEDPPIIVETPDPIPPGGGGESVRLFAGVFGAALAPVHSLDSNSQNPYRKYDLTSLSGGAGVEIAVTDLGPISIRAGYQFAMVSGVTAEENKSATLSGFQHDAQLRVGMPLAAGPLLITPEIGYAFGMFDFDLALPLGEVMETAQFVSSVTNGGLAGVRLQFFATPSVLLGLEGSFMAGITEETSYELGDPGITLGTIAGLGGQFLITDMISIVARYHVAYRTTDFSGNGIGDISEATLSDLSHGLMLGMAFNAAL